MATQTHLSVRNKLAFFLSILSFFFFVPGITLNMLSLHSSGSVDTAITEHVQFSLYNNARSLINTIHDLYQSHNEFVAGMILLFSIIVPIVKGVMLLFIFLSKNRLLRAKLFAFIKAIGKWSMADVFVVAIFLAYLPTKSATHHNFQENILLGIPLNIDFLYKVTAHLEIGFYFFLAYCMMSLLALQLYKRY